MTVPRWKHFRTFAVLACMALIAGCGDGQRRSNNTREGSRSQENGAGGLSGAIQIPGVEQAEVGQGAQAAQILSGPDSDGRRIVIFLHGWGPTTPIFYKAWMSHLVDEGVRVIFPAYQGTALATLPKNVEVSVRAALKRLPVAPSSVVVAGHTSGATLAIDYATSAATAGLPPACAVYGVFPGVSLSATANIPLSEPAKLPATSRLVLVAGPSDPISGGTSLAQAIIADARQIPRSHRSLLNAPGDNTDGPVGQTTASQRTFWRPLDRLIADCGKR